MHAMTARQKRRHIVALIQVVVNSMHLAGHTRILQFPERVIRNLLAFVAVVSLLPLPAAAVPVRISADTLLPGGYDSDVDDFGVIVSGFDLGSVQPGLAGVLLNVTAINDAGDSRIHVDAGSRWNISEGRGSLRYTFSSAVAFHFSTGASAAGPFAGTDVIFTDGELLTFSGDPGNFTFFNPDPVDDDLLVGSNFVHNLSTSPGVDGPIRQRQSYGSTTGLTKLTMTHDDLTTGCSGGGCEGGFHPSGGWHGWVDVAEPVNAPSAVALLLSGTFLGLRKRRRASF